MGQIMRRMMGVGVPQSHQPKRPLMHTDQTSRRYNDHGMSQEQRTSSYYQIYIYSIVYTLPYNLFVSM